MPFKSAKQRRFFHALKNDPALRKRRGIKASVAKKMIAHDKGGRLPEVAGRTKKALRGG